MTKQLSSNRDIFHHGIAALVRMQEWYVRGGRVQVFPAIYTVCKFGHTGVTPPESTMTMGKATDLHNSQRHSDFDLSY